MPYTCASHLLSFQPAVTLTLLSGTHLTVIKCQLPYTEVDAEQCTVKVLAFGHNEPCHALRLRVSSAVVPACSHAHIALRHTSDSDQVPAVIYRSGC